jgi:hypothetical protein
MEWAEKRVLARYTTICYGHFALKSRCHCEFLRRGPAWHRGAACLVALVACGCLAPTALATPAEASATASTAPTATLDGTLPPATSTATTQDLGTAATADQSAGRGTANALSLDSLPAAAPAETPPPDSEATTTTGQSASSAATATQQQPVNVVVIVRVNSPGNNGAVTQNNVAVAPSTAANTASSTQAGGSNAASTAQQAGATATAAQDSAGNYVITVRIDSPGANGPVNQTNGVDGSSTGTNTSNTTQQAAAPASAANPQIHHAAAAASRMPSRHRKPLRHRQLGETAAASVEPTMSQAPTAAVERAATTPDRATTGRTPAHRHPALGGSRDHTNQSTLGRIAGGAARALAPLVPHTSPAADASRSTGPQDVSSPVLLTLLILAAAGGTFALVRRASVRRQPASWRPRR